MIVTVETHGCMWVVFPLGQGHGTLKTFSADMGGKDTGSKSEVSNGRLIKTTCYESRRNFLFNMCFNQFTALVVQFGC
jgi:hypothetical protein